MVVQIFNPSLNLKLPPRCRAKTAVRSKPVSARLDGDSRSAKPLEVNLSVLRFTFGIPGFDESYLPRWLGYGFGSFLLLNHFSGPGFTGEAQLRSEALGLSLAAFSIALPYLGKFLKGAAPAEQRTVPEEAEQIFVISSNVPDSLKEDLAWATYVLLRNTGTVAVLISVRGELCVRGYWNIPGDVSKAQLYDWFKRKIDGIGLFDLKETLYFPQSAGSVSWEMLPKGTCSLLVQPVVRSMDYMEKVEAFVFVASTVEYAYGDKDRAWIGAIANKFRGYLAGLESIVSMA